MALDRAADGPAASIVRMEAPEAAIIIGVADHAERAVGVTCGRREARLHQRFANALALRIRRHRDGADEDQRLNERALGIK